jgi:hypothetical protein
MYFILAPPRSQQQKLGAGKPEKLLDKTPNLWSIDSTESIEGTEWKSGFFL